MLRGSTLRKEVESLRSKVRVDDKDEEELILENPGFEGTAGGEEGDTTRERGDPGSLPRWEKDGLGEMAGGDFFPSMDGVKEAIDGFLAGRGGNSLSLVGGSGKERSSSISKENFLGSLGNSRSTFGDSCCGCCGLGASVKFLRASSMEPVKSFATSFAVSAT